MSKRATKRGREFVVKSRTQLRKILNLKKANGLTDAETAAHFGFSVNTLYNTINRYKQAKAKKQKASGKKAVSLSKRQAQPKAQVTA